MQKQSTNISSLMIEIKKISDSVPDEEWEKLPKDLAANLDKYLYGDENA